MQRADQKYPKKAPDAGCEQVVVEKQVVGVVLELPLEKALSVSEGYQGRTVLLHH